jgi:hypothetical protein
MSGFGLEGADPKPIRCTRISTNEPVLKEGRQGAATSYQLLS